jgi:hypothetical protein
LKTQTAGSRFTRKCAGSIKTARSTISEPTRRCSAGIGPAHGRQAGVFSIQARVAFHGNPRSFYCRLMPVSDGCGNDAGSVST